jgi:hypothetical protein
METMTTAAVMMRTMETMTTMEIRPRRLSGG